MSDHINVVNTVACTDYQLFYDYKSEVNHDRGYSDLHNIASLS